VVNLQSLSHAIFLNPRKSLKIKVGIGPQNATCSGSSYISPPRHSAQDPWGDLMLFRVLLYVNVLGGLSAVTVCALAPFADSIEKLVSAVRTRGANHPLPQNVSGQNARTLLC
jgi:hypothetical protein